MAVARVGAADGMEVAAEPAETGPVKEEAEMDATETAAAEAAAKGKAAAAAKSAAKERTGAVAEAGKGVRHAVAVDEALREGAVRRLRRIEGQVRGLQRMVEDGRYCADILTQISSVHEALRGVGKLLMRNHLEHCVTEALRSGDRSEAERTYEEVLALMYKHAR
ncbi:MAG: metal-sensitive transcriptional regulator [Gemmatimonadota bacterium]